jgi:hypothetical protein
MAVPKNVIPNGLAGQSNRRFTRGSRRKAG